MSEVQENIEAAVANAAAKIAEADTVQEAQQWQSVISNLTSALNQVGDSPTVVNNTASESFKDHDVKENSTDEINVDKDEDVGN